MNLFDLAVWFLETNLFIVLAASLGVALSVLTRMGWLKIGASQLLNIQYLLLSVVIGFVLMSPFLPEFRHQAPAAQIWTELSESSSPVFMVESPVVTHAKFSMDLGKVESLSNWGLVSVYFLVFAVLLQVVFLLRGHWSLSALVKRSQVYKRIGRIEIRVSDRYFVPFSYLSWGRAYVIVPQDLLLNSLQFKHVVHHELQHHRNGDTWINYFVILFKLAYGVNPFVHFWARTIEKCQELSCDERVISSGKVQSQDYCQSLVDVARSQSNRRLLALGTSSFLGRKRGSFLKERVQSACLESIQSKNKNKTLARWVGLLGALVLGAGGLAAKGTVQDWRVDDDQALKWIRQTQGIGRIQIDHHPTVLKEVRKYLGSQNGREYLRGAIKRMKKYEAGIRTEIERFGHPAELLAVPLIESGYRNVAKENSARAKGIWQFVPGTARKYGIRVGSKIDERSQPEKLTVAAMKYYRDLYNWFGDWRLALIAYNSGERALMKAIEKSRSRDPWVILEKVPELGDRNYLPKLMMAMLVLKNPSLLKEDI